jgi:hypothetical protein
MAHNRRHTISRPTSDLGQGGHFQFDRHTLLPSLNFETTVDWDL